jgi:hypothetical protein
MIDEVKEDVKKGWARLKELWFGLPGDAKLIAGVGFGVIIGLML